MISQTSPAGWNSAVPGLRCWPCRTTLSGISMFGVVTRNWPRSGSLTVPPFGPVNVAKNCARIVSIAVVPST
jgi:hypothetical protein